MSRAEATDATAISELKPKRLSQMKRDVLDIVRFAHGRGIVDMTATEIQRLYEKQPGKTGGARGRVADGYFAGRISELVHDGHLLRSKKRQCCETKSLNVNTVHLPSARAVAARGLGDI